MTKDETVQVLAILKAAYPSSYKDMTKKEAYGAISVWSMQFADVPAEIVMMAVQKHISTNKFPPSIAEIKKMFTSIYWDAYEQINTIGAIQALPADMAKQYERICEYTRKYKVSGDIELPLSRMISGGGYLGIEG